jgi:hypothetical protein
MTVVVQIIELVLKKAKVKRVTVLPDGTAVIDLEPP